MIQLFVKEVYVTFGKYTLTAKTFRRLTRAVNVQMKTSHR